MWQCDQSLLTLTQSSKNRKDEKINKKENKNKKENTKKLSVVVTTRWNGTCSVLTSAKLLTGYLIVGITRELNKELLLYYSSIYINII